MRDMPGELAEEVPGPRERILRAALAVASERGYDGTTISLVIARAGLAASSVYWHFKDKDVLLAEAIQYGYDHWRASTAAVSAGADLGFEGVVRARMAESAREMLARPEFWHMGLLLVLQRRPTTPLALDRFHAIYGQLVSELEDWYRGVLPPGARGPEVVETVATFQVMAMGGIYVTSYLAPPQDLAQIMAWVGEAIIEIVRRHVPGGET